MAPAPDLMFPPFRLDLEHEQLWRGLDQVPLRPKTFAVLHYLVTHAPRLVTQAELLQAVWADAYVSEGLLRGYIHELRIVLGDAAQVPRFIETVPRRGWRFLAPVTTASHPADPPPSHTPRAAVSPVPRLLSHVSPLVGRKVELAQLHGWLARALGGERQVVFVTGEPGMGKTALVDTFLTQALAQGELGIGLGQCVEHYGVGEAYLPVLEALGRLCRGAAGDQLLRLLRRYAPTWLAQMPALLEATEREALQPQVHGATQERMVRELAEAIEVLTTVQPLVLWLEDMHWSDYSTLDLLAGLARRRESARLLVLGTYRPAEVLVHRHPLRGLTQDLQVHRQCVEVPLRLLTVAEVTQYLAARFAIRTQDAAPFQALGQTLHQGTDGNPLFMVLVVDALVAQGAITAVAGQWQLRARLEDIAASVPASMRQVIEQQVEWLCPEEQQVLETASVIGSEFTATAVAAGLGTQGDRVEEWCETLVRRGQFLRVQGTARLPDGTMTGRYSFRHAVYQTVLYERLVVTQRIRLHRRIGEGGEALYGSHVGTIAAELAMHFERGQDYPRAVRYLQQAGENAAQRHAPQEVIALVTKGLELLATLPETPARAQQELDMQLALGPALSASKGFAAPEAGQAYDRARALCA